MGGIVLGILVWQEGGDYGRRCSSPSGLAASPGWPGGWLAHRRAAGRTLLDPDLFRSKLFRLGVTQQLLQQIALGGTMIALPIFLQMVLEYNAHAGRALDLATVAEHVRPRAAGRARGGRRAPGLDHPGRLRAGLRGRARAHPDRAARRLRLVAGHPLADRRLRTRAAGLAAEQLHAGADLRGAGQRGGGRQLGGRVVRPVLRAGLRRRPDAGVAALFFTSMANNSTVLPPTTSRPSRPRWRPTPR